jgi:uncharacterized membrane-anchored protein
MKVGLTWPEVYQQRRELQQRRQLFHPALQATVQPMLSSEHMLSPEQRPASERGLAAEPGLPPDHVLRAELNDEVHARPSDPLRAPLSVSYLALLSDASSRALEWANVRALAAGYGVELPEASVNHCSVALGGFTLRWERHTEFTRYTFFAPGATSEEPFAVTALNGVPRGFLAQIPGEILVAAHGALLTAEAAAPDYEAMATRWFEGNVLMGSRVGDAAAMALTDFRVRPDVFSRFLVLDSHLTGRQAGRTVQRVLEIDTYRMLALLALPVARELGPFIMSCERELSLVTTVLERCNDEDEASLLDRLTRLEAQIESREAENAYRFAAAAAYYDLVRRRISELREQRIPGLQTFGEFIERRLAPAMSTCRAAASRQESLSQRVARANQLLATRVDLTRERQNQALLESMNRRAKAQLKLQQTVEGLSVAAVTYYVVGLVGYLAKGIKSAGVELNPEILMAVSIPIVAALAGFGINRIKQAITRKAR